MAKATKSARTRAAGTTDQTKTNTATKTGTKVDENGVAVGPDATTQSGDPTSTTAQRAAPAEGTDVAKFGNSDTETQKAAAVAASRTAPATGDYGDAVSSRQDATAKALAERESIVKEAAAKQEQVAQVESANAAALFNDLQSAPKAPLDNAFQKPSAVADVGIHPDVTSPTNLYAAQEPALPGTGVADPRDLAPGQDMSPSPPISSSNVLPNPDKPGTNFSKT